MKKIMFLAVALTFAFAPSISAQNGPGGAPQQGAPGAAPGGGPGGASASDSIDDQVKSLATQLSLSNAQQDSARAILEEKQKLTQEVRDKFPVAKPGSNPSPEGIAAMTKAMTTVHNKMLAILNDEQKKKYDAIDAIQPGPR